MSEFERKVWFTPGFDFRKDGRGCGCVTIRFALKGERGAIGFIVSTGWYPGEIEPHRPSGLSLDAHTYEPQYDGQTLGQRECSYLDGAPCYFDGSYVLGDDVLTKLIAEGEEAMWAEMERFYRLWVEKVEEAEMVVR